MGTMIGYTNYNLLQKGDTYRVHELEFATYAPDSMFVRYVGIDEDGEFEFVEVDAEGKKTGIHFAGESDFGTEFTLEEMPRFWAYNYMSPQCRTIIQYLKKGSTITQRSALLDFSIAALPRRIADLKEMGFDISSIMEKNKLTGQRYARYGLTDLRG